MAFDPTVLTDVSTEAIKRFNKPDPDYGPLGDLFASDMEMKKVDDVTDVKTKTGVVNYLNATQLGQKPQFWADDQMVAESATIGIIDGHGRYQNSSTEQPKQILFSSVFVRSASGQPWLLRLAFAALLE